PAFRTSLSPFFFHHTATTEIYTLSLHDALPILFANWFKPGTRWAACESPHTTIFFPPGFPCSSHPSNRELRLSGVRKQPVALKRSEEHTSELQSLTNLVCRLLLEKKKIIIHHPH